ncbi:MAG TPA: protocatechuate 3,4-dioxygenase subunit alpha [Thermoleophilaceae bacterium]|nr:protocatechuate 3,4-dioxygenase subunit alpha [Thermoleophilaceae bacterium]
MLPTPSQTVGPFFNIGMPGDRTELVAEGTEGAVRIEGVVCDAEGPVVDALLEIWQAGPDGRYDEPGFAGFGRGETDPEDGTYAFVTVKPGQVPGPNGALQAPHLLVSVFARGLLKRLVTRIYFEDEGDANATDPVLAAVDPDRRDTLIARRDGEAYRFDVRLQGDGETVFFDV